MHMAKAGVPAAVRASPFRAKAALPQQVGACQAWNHIFEPGHHPKPPVCELSGSLRVRECTPQLEVAPAGSLCSQEGAVPAKQQPGAELGSSQSEAQRCTAGASGGTALQQGSWGVQALQPPAVHSTDSDLQRALAACTELPAEQQCVQLRALVTTLNTEKVSVLQNWKVAVIQQALPVCTEPLAEQQSVQLMRACQGFGDHSVWR